ncbi:type VI secretion system baseplate subunit TssK [Methylobacterium persicinum]|uniref:Type VI secretion system protein ImpJ n=1 Tax=Methylobacterium persicinum TaxID=374426 RepID=A0ABU0HKY0_9HYPH|nr:type VI secretion system baseplate subunit TssK [Methylobacterium persicinum]MDQ0442973.1 type VI secretion system protein ImpJ [Methylobacterium persicinum]GJE40235.1 hypothetical protein KHHGKMAE_4326 [Methylobacterium persicinum]
MTLVSKPLWSEGMLVRPQHFQQHDRWFEHVMEGRFFALGVYGWGLRHLALSTPLLPLGKVAVEAVAAILPDGTVIDTETGIAIEPRAVPPTLSNATVKLAVGLRRRDGTGDPGPHGRYRRTEQVVRDETAPERQPVGVEVAELAVRLLFEGEPEDGLVTLPIARIRETDASGAVVLDEHYIPPCLTIRVSPRLVRIVNEIRSLLHSRGEALATLGTGGTESAHLVDLMVLAIVNGQEAVFDHFATLPGLHPEQVYRASVTLAGMLSTFSASRRHKADIPPYDHLDLDRPFRQVLDELRQLLAIVIERNAVGLPLQDRGHGISLSTIGDRTLFQDARFVLIAMASVPPEILRSQLPISTKVGSVETIRDLVNLQLPGIPLQALPVAPRELPFMQRAVYFELDQGVELWRSLTRSAAIALHVSGEYPDLRLELWAIRGQRP